MLKTIITAEMVGGVLDEVTGVIPIILPVSVTFIAIRKGINFVLSSLRSA